MNRRMQYTIQAKDKYENVVKPYLITKGWQSEILDQMMRRMRPEKPNYRDFCITDVTYYPELFESTWSELERIMYNNLHNGVRTNHLVLQAYATFTVKAYAIIPLTTLIDIIYRRGPAAGVMRYNFTGVRVEDKSPRFWLISFEDTFRLLTQEERKLFWGEQ